MMDLWGNKLTEEKPQLQSKKLGLFDCIKSINKNIDFRIKDPMLLLYDNYMVTKAIGQNKELIIYANIMNKLNISNTASYLFYLNCIPKNNFYSAWSKTKTDKYKQKLLNFLTEKEINELCYVNNISTKELLKRKINEH